MRDHRYKVSDQQQNIGSRIIEPGMAMSIAQLTVYEYPAPMIAAAWVEYGCGQDSPGADELSLLQVDFLVDQAAAAGADGNLYQGGQQAMPAVGIRRQLAAQQINIVARLARTAIRPLSIRAHIGFGSEQGESWNMQQAIAVPSDVGDFTLYSVPRFANKWRAFDWGGDTLLTFSDLRGQPGTLSPLPQNVQAASYPEWTPLPAACGLVAMPLGSKCVLQFGRD